MPNVSLVDCAMFCTSMPLSASFDEPPPLSLLQNEHAQPLFLITDMKIKNMVNRVYDC